MVKNLPCSGGDMDLIPDQATEIPYAAEQLSPWTARTLESVYHNQKFHMPPGKIPCATSKTQCSQINSINNFFFLKRETKKACEAETLALTLLKGLDGVY